MVVVPAKKSTREIVFPTPGAADAEIETGDPTETVVPFEGEVIATVGDAAGEVETVTLTAGDVIGAPLESVTRAVRETAPVVVGVQFTVYGAEVAEPTRVAPARKSTLATVAGDTAAAFATRGTTAPTVTPEPLKGLVKTTDGTVTLTTAGEETAENPPVSTARAVRLTEPAVDGIQVSEYGAEKSLPMSVVPARKSTLVIEDPPLGIALATKSTLEPSPSAEPVVGLLRETVGPNPVTVTITRGDVAVLRFGLALVVTTEVSVTVAVKVYVPVAVGNQSIE